MTIGFYTQSYSKMIKSNIYSNLLSPIILNLHTPEYPSLCLVAVIMLYLGNRPLVSVEGGGLSLDKG